MSSGIIERVLGVGFWSLGGMCCFYAAVDAAKGHPRGDVLALALFCTVFAAICWRVENQAVERRIEEARRAPLHRAICCVCYRSYGETECRTGLSHGFCPDCGRKALAEATAAADQSVRSVGSDGDRTNAARVRVTTVGGRNGGTAITEAKPWPQN